MPDQYEVGNQFGYVCPRCKRGDDLKVSCRTWAALLPDGTDGGSDMEWDEHSDVLCQWSECQWSGKVSELLTAPDFEEVSPF